MGQQYKKTPKKVLTINLYFGTVKGHPFFDYGYNTPLGLFFVRIALV